MIIIFNIVLIIILVMLSAFFSGSETALFSLSRARLISYREEKSFSKRCIISLMDSYHATLIVLILGNMFVNSAISMAQHSLFATLQLPQLLTTLLSIITAIVILLLFGEVTPKAIAIANAESISSKTSIILFILGKVLMPLIWVTDRIFSFVLDLLGRKEAKPLNHEEYNSYIEMANSFGAFTDDEAELLEDIFDISKTAVSRFMTGRVDISCINRKNTAEEIYSLIKGKRAKYYPVISKDLDDAQYILSAKDFFQLPTAKRTDWLTCCKQIPITFIPENTGLTKALSIMKKDRVPVALILDEYGGSCGMIENENIYEALLGDIKDEHDIASWHVREINPSTLRVNGTMLINEFEDIMGLDLPPTTASTISGLFYENLEHVPVLGDVITVANFKLKAIKIAKHRVIEAEVELSEK